MQALLIRPRKMTQRALSHSLPEVRSHFTLTDLKSNLPFTTSFPTTGTGGRSCPPKSGKSAPPPPDGSPGISTCDRPGLGAYRNEESVTGTQNCLYCTQNSHYCIVCIISSWAISLTSALNTGGLITRSWLIYYIRKNYHLYMYM